MGLIFDALTGRVAKLNQLTAMLGEWFFSNMDKIPESPEKTYILYTLSFVAELINHLFMSDLHLLNKHLKQIDEQQMKELCRCIVSWSLVFDQIQVLQKKLILMNLDKIIYGFEITLDGDFKHSVKSQYKLFKDIAENDEYPIPSPERMFVALYGEIKEIVEWKDYMESDYRVFHAAVERSYIRSSFIKDERGLFKNLKCEI